MKCADMSFKTNQSPQITLHDSVINQTPRIQKMIMKSWCKQGNRKVINSITGIEK